ncbi:MAG: hypothetical protein OER80_01310 [Gammaproteobacteria bacterium]|nr:hypothetical protein [Gammaproteobacteria bacterium]MDH3767315.1 hypothetical protein [Gammaproteobacteria bacterium]
MQRSILLFLDGAINLILGVLLMMFPRQLVSALGIPAMQETFYPTILGAVLFGIGIALIVEIRSKGLGLGLIGAVAINICGGVVLASWLLFGDLSTSTQGNALLWVLVIILVGISVIELLSTLRKGVE